MSVNKYYLDNAKQLFNTLVEANVISSNLSLEQSDIVVEYLAEELQEVANSAVRLRDFRLKTQQSPNNDQPLVDEGHVQCGDEWVSVFDRVPSDMQTVWAWGGSKKWMQFAIFCNNTFFDEESKPIGGVKSWYPAFMPMAPEFWMEDTRDGKIECVHNWAVKE